MGFGVPGGFGGGGGNSPFGRAQGHVNDYHAMKSTSGGSGFSGGGSWNNKYNNKKNKDSEHLTKTEFERRKRIFEQNIRSCQIAITILWCIDVVLMMACSTSGWWIAILLGVGIIFTLALTSEIKRNSGNIRLLELVYQTQQSDKDNKDAEQKNDQ